MSCVHLCVASSSVISACLLFLMPLTHSVIKWIHWPYVHCEWEDLLAGNRSGHLHPPNEKTRYAGRRRLAHHTHDRLCSLSSLSLTLEMRKAIGWQRMLANASSIFDQLQRLCTRSWKEMKDGLAKGQTAHGAQKICGRPFACYVY